MGSNPPKVYTFEEMLNEKGYFVYTNVGWSMYPLLRERRDIVEIRKKDSERCKKYDVVLYKRNGQYILHRILRVLPEEYVVAGDHNSFLDANITDDDILGVMKRIVKDGKSITMDDPRYRLYTHLWCDCYPLRMFLQRGMSFVRHHLRKRA